MLVLLAMSFLVYGMIGLMPGDPIDLMISGDPSLSSKDADQLKELYGVKKPILERYSKWLFGIFNGDLGFSRLFAKPVFDVLGSQNPGKEMYREIPMIENCMLYCRCPKTPQKLEIQKIQRLAFQLY